MNNHDATPTDEKAEYGATIRELPLEERPRERLLKYGPEVLQTSELLAILFRTGRRKLGAHELARRVISHFGDIRSLAAAEVDELRAIEGIGLAKAAEIKAAFELGKRLATFVGDEKRAIKGPGDVAALLMSEMSGLRKEEFRELLLNTKNQVLKIETVSVGSLDASLSHPRECFRPAIIASAAGVIFAHNHPSGELEPSKDDLTLTRRLKECGELLGIKVLDHVIFGNGKFLSLKERGLL